jgi:hypothetical protein
VLRVSVCPGSPGVFLPVLLHRLIGTRSVSVGNHPSHDTGRYRYAERICGGGFRGYSCFGLRGSGAFSPVPVPVGVFLVSPRRKTLLMVMLSSSTRCLQMPLWPFLAAAAALFGTFSGPQHLTQESHPETGQRSARARRHVPPGRTRARPRAGAPRPSLTAVAPPIRAGTGAVRAVDARRRASMVHQMASATMAAPEPSIHSAASAPTALTAALGRHPHHSLLVHHQFRPLLPRHRILHWFQAV